MVKQGLTWPSRVNSVDRQLTVAKEFCDILHFLTGKWLGCAGFQCVQACENQCLKLVCDYCMVVHTLAPGEKC